MADTINGRRGSDLIDGNLGIDTAIFSAKDIRVGLFKSET